MQAIAVQVWNLTNQDPKRNLRISKTMSYLLRHGLKSSSFRVYKGGYVELDELRQQLKIKLRIDITDQMIREIVDTDHKKRYSIDGTKIRANYGHSVEIDMFYSEKEPPRNLYHGTSHRSLPKIRKHGIRSMSRNYVHLSGEKETARKVGHRHGKPVVLIVDAKQMMRDGFSFFLSESNIWLTKSVPPHYITNINNLKSE